MNFIRRFTLVNLFILSTLPLLPIKADAQLFRRVEELQQAIIGQTAQRPREDLDLIKRIIRSYQQTLNDENNRGQSMWQYIFMQHHIPIHEIFMRGDIEGAAAILRNPAMSDLLFGFEVLTATHQPLLDSQRQHFAMMYLDFLVRFAEAIGAVRLDHPESYPNEPPHLWDADAVIHKIEQTLKQPISFPNLFPNEIGLLTSHGIVTHVALQALYQAWRIKELTKNIPQPRILEIGAGLGRTAYYARQFGIQDYTIVDLPFTALSSGYFLGSTVGEKQILLAGEEAKEKESYIKILTPTQFLASDDSYDLIINANGFTEMDYAVALKYWQHIEKSSPIFLSMNHERNSYTIKGLADASPCVESVHRMPYWMHTGYVEEIVKFKK